MDQTLFLFLSAVCLASVLAMIVSRNQAHNALFLVLCFSSLGAVFGLLDAPFVAVVQIIVYSGAIMVLFLFAIMTVDFGQGLPPEKKKWIHVLAAILAVVLFAEILGLAWKLIFGGASPAGSSGTGDPKELGHLLFTKYLYPFEITSLLLIAALVGALPLARKKESP